MGINELNDEYDDSTRCSTRRREEPSEDKSDERK